VRCEVVTAEEGLRGHNRVKGAIRRPNLPAIEEAHLHQGADRVRERHPDLNKRLDRVHPRNLHRPLNKPAQHATNPRPILTKMPPTTLITALRRLCQVNQGKIQHAIKPCDEGGDPIEQESEV